jgi:hypothetical protein
MHYDLAGAVLGLPLEEEIGGSLAVALFGDDFG